MVLGNVCFTPRVTQRAHPEFRRGYRCKEKEPSGTGRRLKVGVKTLSSISRPKGLICAPSRNLHLEWRCSLRCVRLRGSTHY